MGRRRMVARRRQRRMVVRRGLPPQALAMTQLVAMPMRATGAINGVRSRSRY